MSRLAASGLMILASMLVVACSDGREGTSPGSADRSENPSTLTPTFHTSSDSGPAFQEELDTGSKPVALAQSRLRTGAPPRVPYVAGLDDVAGPFGRQVVVLPGGRIAATLEVARRGNEGYRHLSFAPYAGGWLTEFDDMGPVATLLGPDGAQRRSIGLGPGDVFSRPGRDEVVFDFVPRGRIGFRRNVAVLGPHGLRRLGAARSTAGFLGPHEVVVTTRDGVYRVDTRTLSRTLVPGVSSGTMASSSSGLLIGRSRGAHGVYDARTGVPILASPTYRLVRFNPSGNLVVGYRSSGEQVVLAIADVQSGEVLHAFRWRSYDPPEQIVWEDDRTVLADFIRFRLDGTVERARVLRSTPPYGPYLLPPPIS